MAKFVDGQGNTWHPKVDLGVCERFDTTSDLGILEAMTRAGGFAALLNLRYLLPLLYESCRHEAEKLMIPPSDEKGRLRRMVFSDFKACLSDGQVLADAMEALTEALGKFFPAKDDKTEGDPGAPPAPAGDGMTSIPSPPSPESVTGDPAP